MKTKANCFALCYLWWYNIRSLSHCNESVCATTNFIKGSQAQGPTMGGAVNQRWHGGRLGWKSTTESDSYFARFVCAVPWNVVLPLQECRRYQKKVSGADRRSLTSNKVRNTCKCHALLLNIPVGELKRARTGVHASWSHEYMLWLNHAHKHILAYEPP